MELSFQKSRAENAAATGDTLLHQLAVLLVGTLFGIVLVKSEVVSWFRIQKMFRFEEAHMYLVIASAVMVGALSIYLIRKFQLKTVDQREIQIETKPFQKGMIIGGAIFGMGWAITGACPGPIYAQLGSGEYPAIVTLIAALAGAYTYALLQSRLPH
ncbi:MAG: YeeE/YedE family protein [Anaerolineae bacterium]|nr:YeeE/YedE family protein [Anaerolineae bacterium]